MEYFSEAFGATGGEIGVRTDYVTSARSERTSGWRGAAKGNKEQIQAIRLNSLCIMELEMKRGRAVFSTRSRLRNRKRRNLPRPLRRGDDRSLFLGTYDSWRSRGIHYE